MTRSPIKPAIYGFLIDPASNSISRLEFPTGKRVLDVMYEAIGCDLVEIVYLNGERDGVFVDEEGLLKPQKDFFYIEGTHQPLAGRGVVLGCDSEGETISPAAVTLDWLRANVSFIEHLAPGLTAISTPSGVTVDKIARFFA